MFDSMHSEISEPIYENTNGEASLASQEDIRNVISESDSDEEGLHRETIELRVASEASEDTDSEDSDMTPPQGRRATDDRRISSPTPSGGSGGRSNWAFFGSDMNGFSI